MSEDTATTPVHSSPSFVSLPNDVLFRIFSLLPLRSVLQLEYLSQRLHHAISAYLSTVKCIDLYFPTTTSDIFRIHDPRIISNPILPDHLSKILARCPQAMKISYFSILGTTKDYRDRIDELVYVLTKYEKISQIGFCDNLNLLSAFRKLQPYLDMCIEEVCVNSTDPDYAPPFLSSVCVKNRPRLSLGRNMLDYADFSLLAKFTEIEILDCCLNSTSHFGRTSSTFTRIDFPNLKSFTYSEITRYSYSPSFATLVATVAQSPELVSLRLSVTNFSVLVDIAHNWKSVNLKNLELISAGSYSASLEHISLAPVVAELITVCAVSIETVILSSSLLVKRFFMNLVSKVRCFPNLRMFSMTGIADTKMFLAPGNMVETRYYQDFISICPKLTSISLHSFSGSLTLLALPVELKELVLPWDNRLNLTQHRDTVLTTLSTLPFLEKVTIAGVEEVDSLLQEASSLLLRGPPTLVIDSNMLLDVRITNICIRKLDLRSCVKLECFILHYSPVLQSLLLSATSLQRVYIYDSYHPYMPKFLEDFLLQKERSPSCHLRIQIHSMRKKEPEMATQQPNETKYKELIADVMNACSCASRQLDYVYLCDEEVKLFSHNSGEPLFPFTEFQTCIPSCARSAEDIRHELNRKNCVMEGIRRWQTCLEAVKSPSTVTSRAATSSGFSVSNVLVGAPVSDLPAQHATNFKAIYCDSKFKCHTNIPYFVKVNESSMLCQPSTSINRSDSPGIITAERTFLNVPRLNLSAVCACNSSSIPSSVHEPLRSYINDQKPTLIISTVAYAHDIHTLFYYA